MLVLVMYRIYIRPEEHCLPSPGWVTGWCRAFQGNLRDSDLEYAA